MRDDYADAVTLKRRKARCQKFAACADDLAQLLFRASKGAEEHAGGHGRLDIYTSLRADMQQVNGC